MKSAFDSKILHDIAIDLLATTDRAENLTEFGRGLIRDARACKADDIVSSSRYWANKLFMYYSTHGGENKEFANDDGDTIEYTIPTWAEFCERPKLPLWILQGMVDSYLASQDNGGF